MIQRDVIAYVFRDHRVYDRGITVPSPRDGRLASLANAFGQHCPRRRLTHGHVARRRALPPGFQRRDRMLLSPVLEAWAGGAQNHAVRGQVHRSSPGRGCELVSAHLVRRHATGVVSAGYGVARHGAVT